MDTNQQVDYFGSNQMEESVLIAQIEVKDLLDDFENRVLRGKLKRFNKNENSYEWYEVEGSKKILNEIGIIEILALVSSKVTKAAKLSWKEEEEIQREMYYFSMSLNELLGKRADRWELDIEVAKLIKESAVSLVWDILASSRKGFTAINIRTQYSKQDLSRSDSSEKKEKRGGFFSIPFLGGRNK